MQRLLTLAVLVACTATAAAHVTLAPRESKGGAVETYTVNVPTEGNVSTTSVELEVPAGVEIIDIPMSPAYSFEAFRQNGRIVRIVWRQEIKPAARGAFTFTARNPSAQTLVWVAHQHFADGTAADWIGPAGDRRPAPVVKLVE
jgi:uncharacterized protein YcnI